MCAIGSLNYGCLVFGTLINPHTHRSDRSRSTMLQLHDTHSVPASCTNVIPSVQVSTAPTLNSIQFNNTNVVASTTRRTFAACVFAATSTAQRDTQIHVSTHRVNERCCPKPKRHFHLEVGVVDVVDSVVAVDVVGLDVLCIQFHSAGMQHAKRTIAYNTQTLTCAPVRTFG